jgi:hypothetical protein
MLGEAIGADVEWNSEERAVYITTDSTTTTGTKPVIQSASVNKTYVNAGEIVKATIIAKDATQIKLQDAETKADIEVIEEYADMSDGTRTFEALIKADNETGESVIKSVNVIAGNGGTFYDSAEDIKTIVYGISPASVSSSSSDDDDDDDTTTSYKSDYMVSYSLDAKKYDEGDRAVLTVVTTDDISKVKVTTNFSDTKSEASNYTESGDERTFELKVKMTTTGTAQLYVYLYVEDEGYESVYEKVPVKVNEDDDDTYDELEIVEVEQLNDTVYKGENVNLLVYTSTDVEEVAVFDEDDNKVAKSYYYSGKEDGQLLWNLSFEINHSDKKKYKVYAYNGDDESEVETIKIEGESYSKNDNLVLSVEQRSDNIQEGDTCKFTVKCTSGISYVVLATEKGSEIARATSGSKSGSYRTFTVKGEIDDLDDDYYIYGYDSSDNKESTYKFRVVGETTEEVEILKVDLDDDTVDKGDDIELTIETTTNVEKLTIYDDDDSRVLKVTKPTEEKNSKYIWEVDFEADTKGKQTYTIVVEDDDDNTDEWDFTVKVS